MIKTGRLECPACKSTRVAYVGVDPGKGEKIATQSLARCTECGHSWPT